MSSTRGEEAGEQARLGAGRAPENARPDVPDWAGSPAALLAGKTARRGRAIRFIRALHPSPAPAEPLGENARPLPHAELPHAELPHVEKHSRRETWG